MTRGNLALPLFIATAVPVSIALAAAFDRFATMQALIWVTVARARRDTRFTQQPMLDQGGS